MAVLNSKFDILRGWPDGSAVAEDFVKSTDPAAETAKGVYRHGNFVRIGFGKDNTVAVNYGACGNRAHNTAGVDVHLGLIIEGDEETSSQMSNTVTCLVGGGYVVRLHEEGLFSSNVYGKASIPGGRDQFVRTRAAANDVASGTGLALQANNADFANFTAANNAAVTVTPGCAITVIDGVACAKETGEAEVVVATCLKVGDDFIEILVH